MRFAHAIAVELVGTSRDDRQFGLSLRRTERSAERDGILAEERILLDRQGVLAAGRTTVERLGTRVSPQAAPDQGGTLGNRFMARQALNHERSTEWRDCVGSLPM